MYRSELATRLEGLGLRDRAREERPAGNQRLQRGISGSVESAPPADRGASRKGEPARSWRGANRCAPDARSEDSTFHTKRCSSGIEQIAEAFGNQPERVVEAAREQNAPASSRTYLPEMAQSAVTFSKERNLEREAVVEERDLLRDALRRSMGDAALTEVQVRVREARQCR